MTSTDPSVSRHTNPHKVPVAIIGANGYTGIELVRILLAHPCADLTTITSRQYTGKRLADIFPSFWEKSDLVFETVNIKRISTQNKTVFLCLPHHESMETAALFRKQGLKVIDLSADFRFNHWKTYHKTYGNHSQKKLLSEASYGLCEIFSEDIKNSYLVGVPGCYVTSILLALAPLLQNQLILTDNIICDAKSGTSGAGRSAKIEQIFSEVSQNFMAYGIGNHRHRPEIEEKLKLLAGKPVKITFTPHLLPITRGILSTIYVKPIRKLSHSKLTKVYSSFYAGSPFIQILGEGKSPQIKNVIGTNNCQISIHYDEHSETLIIISAIDNLIKGASGQAVQCFNLMNGLDETCGLEQIGIYP